MKNIDSHRHVRGESVYVDDINTPVDTLHAVVLGSPIARGRLKKIEVSKAINMKGVRHIFMASHIPGSNEIGGIIQDEPLLVEEHIHFKGQPVALILADSDFIGRQARRVIELEVSEESPIVSPREAYKAGEIIGAPRTFDFGDIDISWDQCDVIVEDSVTIGGQEHLYLETQGALAYITEDDHIRIISSTQGPTVVQRTVAKVLDVPMNKVEVDVRRLGGGFGGKEDQATSWAVMAALGSKLTGKPVKLILDRHDDMYMTGKRHPYEADYKIGLSNEGKILAYEVTFYQNAGAAADLSPAVLERTLFHATNSYYIPNVRATGISCRTNVPPNTAFRGFGGPQGMFVIESAITKASELTQYSRHEIQAMNLLKDGDVFPYGQKVEHCQIRNAWEDVVDRYDFARLLEEVEIFNSTNQLKKRGLSLMPVSFGISFTNTSMNQAGALVHIYQDGSVGVSTGAVEMGQGVNTRILQVPSQVFGIDPQKIFIESTNTTRVANTSPSAASSTHDLNGKATLIACKKLSQRLLEFVQTLFEDNELYFESGKIWSGEQIKMEWEELITTAFLHRIDLSEHGYYATPVIHFDKSVEKGHPFAYHAYGVAITQVTMDCLRGRYNIDRVLVSHDFGESMNRIIDLGQMEGGVVQGIGWMTMEDLVYGDDGTIQSASLSTYKIPDQHSAPDELETHFLESPQNEYGLFKSKAIGEPPLMYGIGSYMALYDAMKAFNPAINPKFHSPMTPERVLMNLYQLKIPHDMTKRSIKV